MKFRKKPVTVEAMQFNGLEDYLKILDWVNSSNSTNTGDEFEYRTPIMLIPSTKGTMAANPGDWIIKSENGEFDLCNSGIFEKTYEKTND